MNQIIPFHYLLSMSLDDGLTSVQRTSKKRKEKKNCDGNKIRHASTWTPFLHTFSSLFLCSFFNITRFRMWVNFPPFRDLGLGWFHSTVPPLGRSVAFFDRTFYVAYTNTFLRVANAGEWRCRSDLGGVRGDKTSGRTSKARNEAVAIAR